MIFKLSRLLSNNTKWLEQSQNSILSAALVITVANILSSLSGLLRERLLIASFFHSPQSQQALEAFQVAFQVPDMLFQLLVIGALSAAFIPVFTSLKKKNEQQAFEMSSIVMNFLLLIFITIGAVIFIFAYQLTALRTGVEFTSEQITIAARLTRMMLFAQFFFAISNFLTGILQSYQKFIIPAIAPIIYNLGIVAGVYLFSAQLGIYSAGLGVLMGALAHMLIQLPMAYKLGFRFRFNFLLNFPGVKSILSLMPPRLLAIGVSEVKNLFLGFFATSIGNLSFVVLGLALRLMAIPIRLFGVPISQASLPFLSEESEEGKERFGNLVIRSLHQIAFFAMPASVLLLILRLPIVRIGFGAEELPWRTTLLTSRVVAIIAISVAAQAMVQLLIRAFHALKDTRTPLIVAIFSVAVYLLISGVLVFMTDVGVYSLAIATSVSAFTELLLYVIFLYRRIKVFSTSDFWFPQLKIVLASFFMAVFLYLPYRIFDELIFNTSRTIELVLLTVTTSTIGMLVYIYFCALFDIKELDYFTSMLGKFGKWRKPLQDTDEMILESGAGGGDVT
ncbi:MAG: murein biosynthesis integral membrane protein MurJ [Patescibacteria group bacterium]